MKPIYYVIGGLVAYLGIGVVVALTIAERPILAIPLWPGALLKWLMG